MSFHLAILFLRKTIESLNNNERILNIMLQKIWYCLSIYVLLPFYFFVDWKFSSSDFKEWVGLSLCLSIDWFDFLSHGSVCVCVRVLWIYFLLYHPSDSSKSIEKISIFRHSWDNDRLNNKRAKEERKKKRKREDDDLRMWKK